MFTMSPPNFALYFSCLFTVNMGELCFVYVSHMTTLKQSSHFESANVGGSVTLPCLCQDHITVMFYWYKQTLGEKPKLVLTFYKHSNNSGNFYDEFKNNPRFTLDIGRHTNYLKISDLLVSDSATYYCAMSNLYTYEFCEGTTVTGVASGVLVYFLSGALAFTTILVVLLAFSMYKMHKRNCVCTGNYYSVKLKASTAYIFHWIKRRFPFFSLPDSEVTFSANSAPNTEVCIILY
uniref:Ig-like domain-containing protein n=2 Tax=Monopterus albus TaxID=43700 RepID=A0A3Q3Q230_MONAL